MKVQKWAPLLAAVNSTTSEVFLLTGGKYGSHNKVEQGDMKEKDCRSSCNHNCLRMMMLLSTP